MFSGIVESQARVLDVRPNGQGLLRIDVERPVAFTDLGVGDSVCVNGVCLTIEAFTAERIVFALGDETLKITDWSEANLKPAVLNLERSLRLGDRIHGHLVSGHVDTVGTVETVGDLDGSRELKIRCPAGYVPFVWPKGSWAVNGVSLTVNTVQDGVVAVCLIPETLKRTNLAGLGPGAKVNIEIDMMARGLIHYFESRMEPGGVVNRLKADL